MAESKSTQRGHRFVDVTGKVYGALTVLEFAVMRRQAMWLCRCECGKEVIVAGGHLRNGHTTSCGCTRNVTHGDTGSREYRAWADMKQRCLNPKVKYAHIYSKRGITVCNRWKDSYSAFLADMGRKPFPWASTERIDNDGHYSCGKCEECKRNNWPANCKWATKREQSQNSRKVRNLTYNGETMCLSAWARRLGISINALRNRIKRGWPPERVFSSKHYREGRKARLITYNGETMCLRAWARKLGIAYGALSKRLAKGWPPERVFSSKRYHYRTPRTNNQVNP